MSRLGHGPVARERWLDGTPRFVDCGDRACRPRAFEDRLAKDYGQRIPFVPPAPGGALPCSWDKRHLPIRRFHRMRGANLLDVVPSDFDSRVLNPPPGACSIPSRALWSKRRMAGIAMSSMPTKSTVT